MFAISKVWGWPKLIWCLHMFTRYLCWCCLCEVKVVIESPAGNLNHFGFPVYVRCLAVLSYYFSVCWQNMLFSPALNALHSDFDLVFTFSLPCFCFAWLLLAARYIVYVLQHGFIAVMDMNYIRCLKMLNFSLSVEKATRDSLWVKTSSSCLQCWLWWCFGQWC